MGGGWVLGDGREEKRPRSYTMDIDHVDGGHGTTGAGLLAHWLTG